MNWNPIITWPTAAVYDYLEEKQEPLHEAYRVWGSTRVSCTFCIMSSGNDLHAASRCPDNAEIYRRMVQLEIDSTFGLQGSRWLGDVAPALLDAVQLSGLAVAKRRAQERVQIEAHIPQHLLYKKGWPTAVPTRQEADLLASIRRQISSLLGFEVNLTCADEIVAHYEGLMAARAEKGLALAA